MATVERDPVRQCYDRLVSRTPSKAQPAFVDRVVVPSIVGPGVTFWGEDLLPHVLLAPARRRDVFKALSGLSGQVLLCRAVYPVLPAATRYAMGALERSVHRCFFC